jgi:hypothetical protein
MPIGNERFRSFFWNLIRIFMPILGLLAQKTYMYKGRRLPCLGA